MYNGQVGILNETGFLSNEVSIVGDYLIIVRVIFFPFSDTTR